MQPIVRKTQFLTRRLFRRRRLLHADRRCCGRILLILAPEVEAILHIKGESCAQDIDEAAVVYLVERERTGESHHKDDEDECIEERKVEVDNDGKTDSTTHIY